MVDNTSSKTGSIGRIVFFIGAAVVVLALLYVLFSGGGTDTATTQDTVGTTQTAPAADGSVTE